MLCVCVWLDEVDKAPQIRQYKLPAVKHLVQHSVQLIPCFAHTVTVVAVNHEDKTLCVLEVVSPQWSNLNIASAAVEGVYQYELCRDGVYESAAVVPCLDRPHPTL